MSNLLTMSEADMAAALHMSLETFRRRRSRLMHRDGMPRRIPGTDVWSRLAVEQWINGTTTAAVVDIAAARTALEARIGGAS